MTNNDLFIYATRNKIRFQSTRGELSTEQLWDVPLRSKDDFNLNTIAKAANKALKDATEESFVATTTTPANTRLEVALEVVKSVIATKLTDEDAAKKRANSRAEKEMLLKALAEKQEGALSALSIEDLQKRIKALEE